MENSELEKFGTVASWSRELDLSETTVASRLKAVEAIQGKDCTGSNITLFFPETSVRIALAELLEDLPFADETGFFRLGHGDSAQERYGTLDGWARTLGIGKRRLSAFVDSSKTIKGKTANGRVCIFYAESCVRQLQQHLDSLPITDEQGFVTVNSERYGTTGAWSRVLGLKFVNTLARRLKGETDNVHALLQKNGKEILLYPESMVRGVVSELFSAPQADVSGFFELGNMRHGSIGAFAKAWGINYTTLKNRCAGLQGITGRSPTGQILIKKFFTESDAREQCVDLLPVHDHGK